MDENKFIRIRQILIEKTPIDNEDVFLFLFNGLQIKISKTKVLFFENNDYYAEYNIKGKIMFFSYLNFWTRFYQLSNLRHGKIIPFLVSMTKKYFQFEISATTVHNKNDIKQRKLHKKP